MNTIAKYFLNTVLGLEHLEVEINSEGINGGDNSQYDGNKINKRYQFAKEISQKDAKDAIGILGENVKGSIMSGNERKTFVEIAKTNITDVNYKQIRKSYLASSEGKNFDKSKNNFVNVVSWKLTQTLGDVLKDADILATYNAIGNKEDKFLFLVGLYQILSNDYEQGAKKNYDKVDENDKRISGSKIDFNLVDFIAGPVLLSSLAKTNQDLDDLNTQVKAQKPNLNDRLMEGIPTPTSANEANKTSPETPKETTDQILDTPKDIKEVEERFELGDTGLSIAKKSDGTSSISFERNKVTVWFTKNKESNVITFKEGEVSAPEGKILSLNGEKFRFVPSIEKQKVIVSKIDSSTSSQPQETQSINKIEDKVAIIPNKVETKDSTVVTTPAPTVNTTETDLGDGDKTRKETRKEKKLDKSQEKSTETLTNDSYSGKRIQKASEEIIVQALEETLEDNENVGNAIGLSKTLTTLQDEHKKKAKSLDATSREDQDKLIKEAEDKVTINEEKLMSTNESATAKVLNATKDEISTLNTKGKELEAIRANTDAKENERTNAISKASDESLNTADKITWFNKANSLRLKVKNEKMKEVKNIQEKTSKVSDYYKWHLDAVNKSALIFKNRVKRYTNATNSIKSSINEHTQQFAKNTKQKLLVPNISEDLSGNVIYPSGFDNYLNLPNTIGAAATKELYNKVLENSNKELKTEVDYLYFKLTGVSNKETTDITKLDLNKKEPGNNYNKLLEEAKKSLQVIESEKVNLQNIYKTGPDGYIMIKGNQEADIKEYEILYTEFSYLIQEFLKGQKEYNDKANDTQAQSKLLWDSSTGRRIQYTKWINEIATRMNDLVGNKAGSTDIASSIITQNTNYNENSEIKFLYPSNDTDSLKLLTTGTIWVANTQLKTFEWQENNRLPYTLQNPVHRSVLEVGEDISANTNVNYKAVAADYKNYIESQGKSETN